jgi:hypothetical protein
MTNSGIVGLDPDDNPGARPNRWVAANAYRVLSVATIGGMPTTAAGGTYILEATAALSDGRVLKLNSTVLCKPPGP